MDSQVVFMPWLCKYCCNEHAGACILLLLVFLFSWDKYLEVKLVDDTVVLFFSFKQLHALFYKGYTNLHSHT